MNSHGGSASRLVLSALGLAWYDTAMLLPLRKYHAVSCFEAACWWHVAPARHATQALVPVRQKLMCRYTEISDFLVSYVAWSARCDSPSDV